MARYVVLLGTILLLSAPLAEAQGVKLGAGVSGGINIPVVQDDQGTGSNFAIRGMVRVLPFLTIEPNLNVASYGDPDLEIAGVTNDLEGSDLTAYGVNAILGSGYGRGLRPFLIAGIGFFDMSNDQTDVFDDEDTQFGYIAGAGLGIGLKPYLEIEARGTFNIVPVEDSSLKNLFILAGVNYYFGQ